MQSNLAIKILIVDDAESDRVTYSRYLQSDVEKTYRIIEAETLEEGLQLWRSQQLDVVILDINLPDGNGLEFLEAINTKKAINTTRSINKLPVVVLTGTGDEQIAVRAMKLGATDYLVKGDVTAVSLLTCITQIYENSLLLKQLRNLLLQQLRRSQQQKAELYQNIESLDSSLEAKVQERTQEIQLQAQMLDQIHDAVVSTTLDGTILSWNIGAERLYEYESSEAIGQNISMLYLIEDLPLIASKVFTPLMEKGLHEVELQNRAKSGKIIDISLRLSLVRDAMGNPIRLIGCSNDISDRMILAIANIAKRKANQSDRYSRVKR